MKIRGSSQPRRCQSPKQYRMHGSSLGTDHRADARSGGRMMDRLRQEQAMERQQEREPRKAQRRPLRTVERRQPAAPVAPALLAVADR